jgi:hypothetical protein
MVRNWFAMRRLQTHIASGVHNPFHNWFSQIRRLGKESTNRLSDFQWYMKSKTYGPKVKKAFADKYADQEVPHKYRVHYLCEVAKGLLAQESEEVRKELEEANKQDHQRRVEEARKLLSGETMSEESSSDPIVQAT